MAMVVEDGTIVTGANSYVSLAYASAYHADRGNVAWDGSDEVLQAALIRATDYLTQAYTEKWKGYVVSDLQALDWPRVETTYDEDVIPEPIKRAVCELALEALTATLNAATGGTQAVIRKKVDVIEVEYDKAITPKRRPAIDGLLRGLLAYSALNAGLVRT